VKEKAKRTALLAPSRSTDYVEPMPIYEFHCEQCDHDSEILVRSSDWKGTKCPHCGSAKIAKKFSTFASASAGETSSGKPSGGGGHHCCGGGCHH
jgi:putative FmdB family regulatory protein